jgi:uracil-DNA glycosylase family 4
VSADDRLAEIAEEIRGCQLCRLAGGRTNAVPGEGPANARIVFIGEGPGFHEDQQGRPFVGAAGSFLEELLDGIGLGRQDVYITNLVKCRPPGNRDPQPDELDACTSTYLDRQLEVINPDVIVTLGRFSMARYFPNAKISKIHGQAKVVGGRLVVAMYHPAAALHQPSLREVVERDFARLPDWIERAEDLEPTDAPAEDDPQQLSLF